MARQKGIVKLQGTIGDISFYKSADGFMAKEKSAVDGERIANDPAFIRTRENMNEFGTSAKSAKFVRTALYGMINTAKDNRVSSRLMGLMSKIKNMDSTSARGLRNVGIGIAVPAAKQLLKGFNFNKNSPLASILFKPYAVNTGTGVITIAGLKPIDDIATLAGATHINLKGAFARMNFVTGQYDIKYTNVVNLPINGVSTNVTLTPTGVPGGIGVDLFLLQVEFFQLVNGVQYSLKNGEFNALSIVEVV